MKKVGITLGIMISAIVLGFGIYHSNASQSEPQLSSEEIKQIVSAEYPGEIVELTLSKIGSEMVYKVNFEANETEYELELNGNTGEVIQLKETPIANKEQMVIDEDKSKNSTKEKEEPNTSDSLEDSPKETDTKKPSKQETDQNEQENRQSDEKEGKSTAKENLNEEHSNQNEANEKQTAIDIGEAVEIALSKFSGTVIEVELKEENGRLIYEVEIESGEEEAEIEIDAYTGEVIVIEIDRD